MIFYIPVCISVGNLLAGHDLRVDKIMRTYLGLTLVVRDDSNSVKKLENKEIIQIK